MNYQNRIKCKIDYKTEDKILKSKYLLNYSICHDQSKIYRFCIVSYNSFIIAMENSNYSISANGLNISQYKPESDIFSNSATDITVMSNGMHRIVRKLIKLTSQNKDYAEYQIKLMKAINHPHVVKHIYHQKIDNKQIHLFMPYYQNKDLEDYLKVHQSINFQTKVDMFIDILVGIKELHSKFIIHRDLKLKNIFIDQQSKCIIGDLGISTCSPVSVISRIGTIPNQAPQVYSEQQYNEKVDLWAIGIIAYQIFNNKRNQQIPFPFKSEKQLKQKILFRNDNGIVEISHENYLESTSKIVPCDSDLPQIIQQMIKAMLQNDVKKRPTWIEFYEKQYLFNYDKGKRLATFCAQYKYISQTKKTLRKNIEQITLHRPIIIQLSNLLSRKHLNVFAKKYTRIQQNILFISIFLFCLMEKSIKNYNFLIQKCIYKYVKELKPYFKFLDRQIFQLQQKINFHLRQKGQPQIRKQTKIKSSKYINQNRQLIEQILKAIEEKDRQELKDEQLLQ